MWMLGEGVDEGLQIEMVWKEHKKDTVVIIVVG